MSHYYLQVVAGYRDSITIGKRHLFYIFVVMLLLFAIPFLYNYTTLRG